MAKVFISPESRGAPHGPYAGFPGVYEHDVCTDIGELLQARLVACGIDAEMADKGSTMASRVAWANSNNVDYYICLHTNAGGGTGTECLYYNHPLSIKANQLVYDELTKLYPSKRGIKDYSHFYENKHTKMVSCYPEIAFHDNREDVKFILNNKEAIADALCRGICAFFGVEYKADSTDLRAEIERLEQEIALRDEQTGELHDRIDRLNDEIAAKDDEIATREQQTREVEAKVAALKAKAAQMQMLAAEMLGV